MPTAPAARIERLYQRGGELVVVEIFAVGLAMVLIGWRTGDPQRVQVPLGIRIVGKPRVPIDFAQLTCRRCPGWNRIQAPVNKDAKFRILKPVRDGMPLDRVPFGLEHRMGARPLWRSRTGENRRASRACQKRAEGSAIHAAASFCPADVSAGMRLVYTKPRPRLPTVMCGFMGAITGIGFRARQMFAKDMTTSTPPMSSIPGLLERSKLRRTQGIPMSSRIIII